MFRYSSSSSYYTHTYTLMYQIYVHIYTHTHAHTCTQMRYLQHGGIFTISFKICSYAHSIFFARTPCVWQWGCTLFHTYMWISICVYTWLYLRIYVCVEGFFQHSLCTFIDVARHLQLSTSKWFMIPNMPASSQKIPLNDNPNNFLRETVRSCYQEGKNRGFTALFSWKQVVSGICC